MVADPKIEAALALHRFGLGPRVGSIAAVAGDPRGALLADLRSGSRRLAGGDLLTSGEAVRAGFEFRQRFKAARQAAAANRGPANVPPGVAASVPARPGPVAAAGAASKADTPAAAMADNLAAAQPKPAVPLPQKIYLRRGQGPDRRRARRRDRLCRAAAWFWSNHFCVSADKAAVPRARRRL